MMPSAKLPEQDAEYGRRSAEVRRSLRYSTYFIGDRQKSQMPLVDSLIAQRFGSEEVGSLSTACVLILSFSLIDWYRNGWSLHTALLIGGAIASILTSFFLVLHCVKVLPPDNKGSVRISMIVFTLIGFVPFLFALYLILFQGLYMVVVRFSVGQLVQSVFFLLCGHWIATRIRRLQEFQSCVYGQLN
jgi:hypothetical protein